MNIVLACRTHVNLIFAIADQNLYALEGPIHVQLDNADVGETRNVHQQKYAVLGIASVGYCQPFRFEIIFLQLCIY